jgi:beta-glucanase (GH16 family)
MSAIRSCCLVCILCATLSAQTSAWKLMWNDEFDGAANTAPDPTKWTYDTGGGGWGNNELETYTNSTNNVFLDGNGHLVIQALAATSNGFTSYTSGRLLTQGLFKLS